MIEIIGTNKVRVSRDGVAAFNSRWPASSLRYWFDARVVVYVAGKAVGVDYLCGCAYRNAHEFYTAHLGDGGSYFTDMVRSAVSEARKALSALKSIPIREAA